MYTCICIYIYIYQYEHLYLPKPFRRLVQRAAAFSGSQLLLSFQAIQLRLELGQLIQDLWRRGARNLDGFSKKKTAEIPWKSREHLETMNLGFYLLMVCFCFVEFSVNLKRAKKFCIYIYHSWGSKTLR